MSSELYWYLPLLTLFWVDLYDCLSCSSFISYLWSWKLVVLWLYIECVLKRICAWVTLPCGVYSFIDVCHSLSCFFVWKPLVTSLDFSFYSWSFILFYIPWSGIGWLLLWVLFSCPWSSVSDLSPRVGVGSAICVVWFRRNIVVLCIHLVFTLFVPTTVERVATFCICVSWNASLDLLWFIPKCAYQYYQCRLWMVRRFGLPWSGIVLVSSLYLPLVRYIMLNLLTCLSVNDLVASLSTRLYSFI